MRMRALLALPLGFACAVLMACGDRSELVPANDAAALKDDIAAVEQALRSGSCQEAVQAAGRLRQDASNLPPEVDDLLRERVRDGAV